MVLVPGRIVFDAKFLDISNFLSTIFMFFLTEKRNLWCLSVVPLRLTWFRRNLLSKIMKWSLWRRDIRDNDIYRIIIQQNHTQWNDHQLNDIQQNVILSETI
jgi:hypothetical protein